MMMFLEFFLWGGWGFAITGYAQKLGFTGAQIGLLGAVPAIGAMISPLLVGPIADKFFPAQRVLSVLHLLGGVCLILAGFQTKAFGLTTLMMLNGLFFMPTIALVNAVAFRHIPDPDKFPRIAVLGTVGWIMAVVIASVFLGGATERNFLFQSGVAGIVLALYCWTLPNTPPKGAKDGGDAIGLGALKLLKQPAMLIFIICVFLVSIPACGFFFTLLVPMLQQRGYPSPLALTTLNQFAEIIFMFSMPWFVSKLGLKRVVMIGMLAWAVRYLLFACPASWAAFAFPAALLGLVLHGFCYSFFYVGAYMYVDKRAPVELKASAQSLLTFLLIGVGWFVGSNTGGYLMQKNPPAITYASRDVVVKVDEQAPAGGYEGGRTVVRLETGTDSVEQIAEVYDGSVAIDDVKKPLPPWNDPDAATSIWRYLDLSGTAKKLMGAEEPEAEADLVSELGANDDGEITMAAVKKMPDSGVEFGDHKYLRDDMVSIFKRIDGLKKKGAASEDDISLTRNDWLVAQACNWTPIWFWPSIAIFVVLVVFVFASRETSSKEETPDDSQESPDDKEPNSEPPTSEEESEPEKDDEG